MKKSIYIDQAATSYPKPPVVIQAMQKSLKQSGNPGRASHHMARNAAKEVFTCRTLAAQMFDTSAERVVFTSNTTAALNMAIKGLLPPHTPHAKPPHILCSDMEHNAVYRPLVELQKQGRITFDTFDTLTNTPHRTTAAILDSLSRKCRPETIMVVCAHASNLCSATLPIKEIGEFCHKLGLYLVIDAAQSAGHMPIKVNEWHIQALCLPGHKGLLGPMGVGMLLLGENVMPHPILQGGNGVDSLLPHMGEDLPERLEAGTIPTPCIAGLGSGLRYIQEVGIDEISAHQNALGKQVCEALLHMPHVHLYVPHHQGGVVLFSVEGIPSEEVGQRLDQQGICVRAGFHCSALGHATLQTPDDGAVRASFGYMNTRKEADAFIDAVSKLK